MRIRAAAPRKSGKKTAGRVFKRRGVMKDRRFVRSDASPYTLKPSLQRANIEHIEKSIRKNPDKFRTDKFTLLEIADRILERDLAMPRPGILRSHMVFAMFAKQSGRIRSGVKTACLEWQGAFRGGMPVLTTAHAQGHKNMLVDARKYILENPANGPRRNFRSIPQNLCGNEACVHSKHIEMVPSNPDSHVGENHPRAKFTDKDIRKMVKEYNAGATAKELGKKWKVSLTYIEQVMRKEKRTEATEGMTIRGRFGEWT